MAVLKKLIHKSEKGIGNEDWYYLARNTDTNRVFVIHEWSHNNGDLTFRSDEAEMGIAEFLEGGGTRQDRLLEMIGTLVVEE